EDLLLGRVAVRRRSLLAGGERAPVQPALRRAGSHGEPLRPAPELRLDVVEVDDRRRPLSRVRPLEVLPAVERMGPPARLDPRGVEPRDADLRQVGTRHATSRPVDEHVEAAVAAAERVGLAQRGVDEAVAGTDLVRLAVLPGETG